MSYRVRWKLNGKWETFQSRETYAVPAGAIDFASTILAQDPLEIWIEGPGDCASSAKQFPELLGTATFRAWVRVIKTAAGRFHVI